MHQFTLSLQFTRVPFSLHPYQHLLSLVLLIIVILTRVKWYLIVVLICISLRVGDVEHLCMYLLAISMSSLGKCLFTFSAQFLIGFWGVACKILVPWSRIKSTSLAVEAQSLNQWTAREVPRWFSFFLLFSCVSSLCSLDINPLSDIWFMDIFFIEYVSFSFCWWFPLLCRSSLVWM